MTYFEQAKISEVKKLLSLFLKPGTPQVITPYLVGFPGIGKSQIVAEFAKENGFQLIDLRLSQCLETDLIGIPREGGSNPDFCQWKAPANIPWEKNKDFAGTKGILFLDELPQADEAVIKASFQLVHDHQVGANKLNKDWFIVAAGNLGTEDGNDGLTMFPTALKDRLAIIHVDKNSCAGSWFDYAESQKLNEDIIGYLRRKPERLYHEFDCQGEKIYCTPRRWEKLCRLWEQNKDMTMLAFIESVGRFLIYDLAGELALYLEENAVLTPQDVIYHFEENKERILAKKQKSEDAILGVAQGVCKFIADNMVRDENRKWVLKDESKQVRKNIIEFLKLLRDDHVYSFMKELITKAGFKVLDFLNLRLGEEHKAFWKRHLALVPESERPDPKLDLMKKRDEIIEKQPMILAAIKKEIESRVGHPMTDEEIEKMVAEEIAKAS